MQFPLQVLVWNEGQHEKRNKTVQQIYPHGICAPLVESLRAQGDIHTQMVTLDDPEQGLSEETLAQTDVLVWWGHVAHDQVRDEFVDRVQRRVLEGMGLVVLHSGHHAKIFRRLMGTTCSLRWREDGLHERLWVVDPGHPIADGLPPYFEIPQDEMYGEHFDIPAPDAVVLISWFAGGEVFRSGCCFHRGRGKIFYFRPGHETFPVYYQKEVQQVIANGVRWAAPGKGPAFVYSGGETLHAAALEPRQAG